MVHRYRHGSICLISVKLCYGLIFDLVQLFLFCFVCLFVFDFVFVFCFCFFGCGWWLQVEKWKRKHIGGCIFYFFSLLLWFVVVVGGGDDGGGGVG